MIIIKQLFWNEKKKNYTLLQDFHYNARKGIFFCQRIKQSSRGYQTMYANKKKLLLLLQKKIKKTLAGIVEKFININIKIIREDS